MALFLFTQLYGLNQKIEKTSEIVLTVSKTDAII